MRGEAQTVRSEVQVVRGGVPSVRDEMHGLEKRMEEDSRRFATNSPPRTNASMMRSTCASGWSPLREN
jgi:hypothetical protein